MTDLIALAKQAEMKTSSTLPDVYLFNPTTLQAFADLIRKDEREACESLCSAVQCHDLLGAHLEYMAGKEMARAQCVAAIRARTTT